MVKEKCVACGLCSTVCPSECIHIESAENEQGDRYAKVYEIDMLRCIFCGYCQEVCPEDAIFLRQEYDLASSDGTGLIYGKERLLSPLKKQKQFTAKSRTRTFPVSDKQGGLKKKRRTA